MKLIAHRGNTHGSKPMLENSPKYVDEAIKAGFDVEVDLWESHFDLMLGHDEPEWKIDARWLVDRKQSLWVHCKNIEALATACTLDLNCFYHSTDDFTLTLHGNIWAYPGEEVDDAFVVCVMPETQGEVDWPRLLERNFYGICSDYVGYANVQRN